MQQEEKTLRELAKEYRQISMSERNIRSRQLQTAVNDLHMERPVVLKG